MSLYINILHTEFADTRIECFSLRDAVTVEMIVIINMSLESECLAKGSSLPLSRFDSTHFLVEIY